MHDQGNESPDHGSRTQRVGFPESRGPISVTAGRSPAAVERTVQTIQSGGLCGANWKKGEAFVG